MICTKYCPDRFSFHIDYYPAHKDCQDQGPFPQHIAYGCILPRWDSLLRSVSCPTSAHVTELIMNAYLQNLWYADTCSSVAMILIIGAVAFLIQTLLYHQKNPVIAQVAVR